MIGWGVLKGAWAVFRASSLARALGKAAVVIVGVLTMRALWRRDGAQEANARRDAADAKETINAHEVRNDVEDRISRGGSAKQRLHERWSRKP